MSRFLYVHIPFCEVICHYCHFYTARTAETDQRDFFAALESELDRLELAPTLDAVYFGGGTPSASPPELLARFLEKLAPRLTSATEITLEANPSSVRAREWKAAGINRLSLGVQSLDEETLKRVGRAHSSADALRALDDCAREIGNVSCDLLYGVPEQPEETPALHARKLRDHGARHLSLYHLTLEPEHFLHAKLPPDEHAWKQLRHVADTLPDWHHYEVASFCEKGRESRNNRNYWSGGPYAALGPSAHGFDGNRTRWSHVSDWREYVRRAREGVGTRAWTETLTDEQRRIETIFTSLRTSDGLDLDSFRARFGEDLPASRGALLARWENEGLAHVTNRRLVLTFPGRMLGDEIAKALL